MADAMVEIEPGSVDAAEQVFPAGTPVHMLNLLRFREIADDGPGAPSRSGQDAYLSSYVPAFNRIVEEMGIEGVGVVFAGAVQAALVAPESERWDVVAIATYPDFAAFRRIEQSPEYVRDAYPHRAAALADLRLFATIALQPPTGTPSRTTEGL